MANILTTMKKMSSLWKAARLETPSSLEFTSERIVKEWGAFESLIQLSNVRREKYKDYDEMDNEITELSSSLDLYADFIVSGGSSSEDVYAVEAETANKKISAIIDIVEKRLQIKSRIWYLARCIAKYGDAFYEVVISPDEVVKFVKLSPYTVFYNRDKNGNADQVHPYIQKSRDTLSIVAEFEPWEIVHFKMGEEDYGVDYSVFHNSRRTYKVVRMLEDSVLVGRLTRAHQRLVYKIDVTNMGTAEALRYIEKLKDMYKTRRYMDSQGRLRTEENPLRPQEDIWLPVRKDRNAGVVPISPDSSVNAIADVEHFHNKLFAGTKAPKAYLGFERDVNAKATLTQQHLAFTKAVRRLRHVLAMGLRHLYKVEFLMKGIDPNAFDWKLKFPGLGAADDELKWDIEGMKATMVKTYTDAGIFLPPEWVVRHVFLDLTPTEADELIALIKGTPAPVIPGKEKGKEKSAEEPEDGRPGDARVDQVLELLKQDEELQRFGEHFKQIKRTGDNYEYY